MLRLLFQLIFPLTHALNFALSQDVVQAPADTGRVEALGGERQAHLGPRMGGAVSQGIEDHVDSPSPRV
jgi:hypothetical protein